MLLDFEQLKEIIERAKMDSLTDDDELLLDQIGNLLELITPK